MVLVNKTPPAPSGSGAWSLTTAERLHLALDQHKGLFAPPFPAQRVSCSLRPELFRAGKIAITFHWRHPARESGKIIAYIELRPY